MTSGVMQMQSGQERYFKEPFHTVLRTWVTAPENTGLFISLAHIIRKGAANMAYTLAFGDFPISFDSARAPEEAGE